MLCGSLMTAAVCALTGNNTFLCSGILMLGPHGRQLLLSIGLLTGTWCFVIVLIIPFFSDCKLFLLWTAIIGYTINLGLLFATAFTEPGIYVRRTKSPEEDLLSPSDLSGLSSQERQQYCTVCGIFKHRRARHCKYCNNCVDVFDHHCPVSVCLLLRNR